MKVVILCGGLGMRLREETEFRPKPLVEVGGRPILWHIMKHYAAHGFREFVLCLGYKGELLKHYFLNYHLLNSSFTVELGHPPRVELHSNSQEDGWKVTLVDTGPLAQTGARLKRVERFVTEPHWLMTYGDGVCDVNLNELIAFHHREGRLATVTGVRPPARFGEIAMEGTAAREFREKPQTTDGRISGGFFVLDRRVFDYLEDEDSCNFEKGPLSRIADEGQLTVYCHEGFWQCMDTYRDLVLLNDLWNSGEAPWRTW
ncbi:MAG: glucose-1-phosphate cytidylyltransferase [Candidatus Eremiobacterota bacterium]